MSDSEYTVVCLVSHPFAYRVLEECECGCGTTSRGEGSSVV